MRVKIYLIIIHVVGWLLFMAFPLLFLNGGGQTTSAFLLLQSPWYWVFCFTYIFLFYINSYLFIPWLFLKKNYAGYALVVLLLYTGIYFLQPYDRLLRGTEPTSAIKQGRADFGQPGDHRLPPPDDRMPPGDRPQTPPGEGPPPYPGFPPHDVNGVGFHRPGVFFDSSSLFIFVMIMALGAAIKTIRQWQVTEQRALTAEADRASAELSFLKAQINPHFLFNTLNNIYTLAVIKDDHAPDSIMKLSNIMRYITDDAAQDFVPLQSELDCINDYIELQRLRLGDKTTVDMRISGDPEQKSIAPLILMTFIENVFKYGVSKHERSAIIIDISADENNILFFCKNSIFSENRQNTRDSIGIKNTKKRLEHLYPGKHSLIIVGENGLYTVKLSLQT